MAHAQIDDGKSYRLQDRNSGHFLQVYGDNAIVSDSNSPEDTWIFHRAGGVFWKLENARNHKHLQADPNDDNEARNVDTWLHTGEPGQALWRIESCGDGYSVLTNQKYAQQLEVGGARTDNNANVNLWRHNLNAPPPQSQWKIMDAT